MDQDQFIAWGLGTPGLVSSWAIILWLFFPKTGKKKNRPQHLLDYQESDGSQQIRAQRRALSTLLPGHGQVTSPLQTSVLSFENLRGFRCLKVPSNFWSEINVSWTTFTQMKVCLLCTSPLSPTIPPPSACLHGTSVPSGPITRPYQQPWPSVCSLHSTSSKPIFHALDFSLPNFMPTHPYTSDLSSMPFGPALP